MNLQEWLDWRNAQRKVRQKMRLAVPKPYDGPVGSANVAKERWDNILQSESTDWDTIEKEAGEQWDDA